LTTAHPSGGPLTEAPAPPTALAPPHAPQRITPPPTARGKALPLLVVLLVGVGLWFSPAPSGVEPAAWHLLAVFVATIVGLILNPLPPSALSLVAITVLGLTRTLTMQQTLSGFGNPVVWLIVAAFFIACGFTRTGLGTRIAYLLVRALGGRSLGLGYSLIATDLVLAPGIPSNTARAGGVVLPILRSLGKAFDSDAESGTERRISAFLTITAYQGTVVTSAMFLTAIAVNPLIAGLARGLGVEITWATWALAASVPGVVSLLVVPAVIFRLYPPEIRETHAAAALAASKLAQMGPMSGGERIMLGVFAGMLVLWSLSGLGVDTTAAAFAGVGVLLVTGVLTWDDLVRERDAWSTMVWFATLLMMAGFLNELGLMAWFNGGVGRAFQGWGWPPTLLGVSLLYFYTHYFFAGNSAHAGAMYVPFLSLCIAVGAPPLLAALVLAYFSSLMAGLTHYGTAPGPIFFGTGNVPLRTWWRLGAVLGFLNIAIWLGVGGVWWRVLGLW
jgi:DASS family divalent anion:Na+ symporter